VRGGIAQLFLNLGTKRWVCGQHHAPAAFTSGKDPVLIVQGAGWDPEPVWIGAENLAPPGFDPRTFQDVPSRYTDYAIPAPSLCLDYLKMVASSSSETSAPTLQPRSW
jgi:hypothetical protein